MRKLTCWQEYVVESLIKEADNPQLNADNLEKIDDKLSMLIEYFKSQKSVSLFPRMNI